ncbi:protein of unknown function [Pararobbsia alpina]
MSARAAEPTLPGWLGSTRTKRVEVKPPATAGSSSPGRTVSVIGQSVDLSFSRYASAVLKFASKPANLRTADASQPLMVGQTGGADASTPLGDANGQVQRTEPKGAAHMGQRKCYPHEAGKRSPSRIE